MSPEQEIQNFIGKIVAYGGGAAVIAYGLFVFLGKKWLENKFNERLTETKYKIDSLFSRVSKIHQKEFEVLPEAWGKMHDALIALSRFTSVYKQYPDLDRMSKAQLEEFLKDSFLYDFQRDELRNSQNKLEYYQNCLFYHELGEVKKAFSEFHSYIQKNRIFLSTDLKEYFTKIDDVMWSAMVGKEVGYEAKDYKMMIEAWKKVKDENINPLKDKIEELVQDRLRYDKAK